MVEVLRENSSKRAAGPLLWLHRNGLAGIRHDRLTQPQATHGSLSGNRFLRFLRIVPASPAPLSVDSSPASATNGHRERVAAFPAGAGWDEMQSLSTSRGRRLWPCSETPGRPWHARPRADRAR